MGRRRRGRVGVGGRAGKDRYSAVPAETGGGGG